MLKVEAETFPRRMACGLRKLTTNHLLAARLAERARGLPEGVRHPNQLLAALRRAAPFLGQTGLLPLMEELFRWTQPQDWAPDSAPIVWPGNEDLAHALGCSERHVSRLIAAAIEARLIVARDGSDRRRRGLRQQGRILWAWGLDLRPMAARYPELLRIAAEGEEARRQGRILRRQASAARNALLQRLALAAEQGHPPALLAGWAHQAADLCTGLRRLEDPARLSAMLGALHALSAQLESRLGPAVDAGDMSGLDDSGVRPNIPTNTPTESEGITVMARREAAPAEPAPSPRIALSAEEMVRLAPALEPFLTEAKPAWPAVSDAAARLASHLGISRASYAEACQLLGRIPAAIAIGVISTRKPGHFHSSGPGGYLHGMLRRAREGSLHLERSIFGLREASGDRRRVAA